MEKGKFENIAEAVEEYKKSMECLQASEMSLLPIFNVKITCANDALSLVKKLVDERAKLISNMRDLQTKWITLFEVMKSSGISGNELKVHCNLHECLMDEVQKTCDKMRETENRILNGFLEVM